jgi:DNA-binding transcriptional regulator YiaG
VAVLARLGTELQAERQAQRAKLAVAPEEVKAARISPLLIKKLRARLGITQGELATLVGVSASAVGSWEYGKAKPEGHNREALVALRKLGKREVAGILAAKGEGGDGKPKAGPGAGRSAGNRTATAGMCSHFRRRVFLNNCRCAIVRRLVNTSKMVGCRRAGCRSRGR